jgi:hypothetical protein
LLVAVGLFSAFWGFLQAVGIGDLNLYTISHRGLPIGIFANKNHQAVTLLWLMLGACWLAARADPHRYSAHFTVVGAVGLILVLFPLLILTGSRAGLLLCLPVLVLCGWLLLAAPATKNIVRRAGALTRALFAGAIGLVTLPLLFIFGVLAFSDRESALSRLFEDDTADELRWMYLPTFLRMVGDFLPLGAGFGSFENVFDRYEPGEMLSSRYMNQAHNDPVQLVMEGGLPALAILLVALAWFAVCVVKLWRSPNTGDRPAAAFLGGSIVVWLAASLVDYPLRTPLVAMLFAILTAHLSILSTRNIPAIGGSEVEDLPEGVS